MPSYAAINRGNVTEIYNKLDDLNINSTKLKLYKDFLIRVCDNVLKYYPFNYELIEKRDSRKIIESSNKDLNIHSHLLFCFAKTNIEFKEIATKSVFYYIKGLFISGSYNVYEHKNIRLKISNTKKLIEKIFDFNKHTQSDHHLTDLFIKVCCKFLDEKKFIADEKLFN